MALELLFLPLELLIGLSGAAVFVSVPVAVLAGVQGVGTLEALGTMAVAGVFAWWGGSTASRQVVDLFRGATLFEGRVDDVVMTKERSGKGGLRDVLVLHLQGRAFRVTNPPVVLSRNVHRGVTARVLELPGSRTVREIWVLRG